MNVYAGLQPVSSKAQMTEIDCTCIYACVIEVTVCAFVWVCGCECVWCVCVCVVCLR